VACDPPADDGGTEYLDRFRDYYSGATDPVVRELERRVLGTDYGGNSYTDVVQADELVDLMDLGPGSALLDIGSGLGWPGLYLAARSGCRVVLSDVPIEGLHHARNRAAAERLRATAVATSGVTLPFRDASFDAVTHSDVLC
jgi:SAM-dependent methyltransferase